MQIGPFHVALRQSPPAPPADSEDDYVERKLRESKAKGASGTINMQGYLQTDEYLNEWRGPRYLGVVDRMVNDGAVEEAMGHMTEPAVAALTDLQIEPASEELQDQYAAELCRCALFEWLDQDVQEFWRQVLELLAYGHSVFEVTEQIYEAPLTIDVEGDDGESTTETHANTLWRVPCRFEPRLQRTITKWHSERGRLTSIEQQAYGDDGAFQNVDIPADDLLVFTFRRRGDNYMGRSILRAAYKAWYLKDVVEKTMVVSIERHGVGVWSVHLPKSAEDDDAMADRCEDILANLRSGEFSYAVWPFPKNTGVGDQSGGTVEILTPSGGLPTNLTDVAEYFRGDIKAALLTRFSELGHGTVGARSTGETQTEVWHRSLESLGALVCGVLKGRFDKIVADNLPGARTPTVKPAELESKSLEEFAKSLGGLVSAGAIEPDKSLREWARRELGAPDEDEGTDEQVKKESEAGAQLPLPGIDPTKADPTKPPPGDPGADE